MHGMGHWHGGDAASQHLATSRLARSEVRYLGSSIERTIENGRAVCVSAFAGGAAAARVIDSF